jgi:AbrB family looped-hinge helix DNA binding protein
VVRARISSKGQLTIPQEIRERYGLDTGDEVEFISEEKGAYLIPLKRRKLTDLYGILPATRPWLGIKRAREIYGKKIGEEYVRKNKVRR